MTDVRETRAAPPASGRQRSVPPSTRRHAIGVHCSATSTDPVQLALATRVGSEIACRGWRLVESDGSAAMLGAVARAARAHSGRTVAVVAADETHPDSAGASPTTPSWRERKREMDNRADAHLFLPGGVGTTDTFLEAWTNADLGLHNKPLVLLDPYRHYRGLLAWLDELRARNFIGATAFDRVTVTADLHHAFAALAGDSSAPPGPPA
ncbi:TIGR00730 family Rossman fold protein [Nocardia sp. R6R-6]|uniref:TIGR00730 family Rossman fold protein n=1 Tax=Nocardia sp. R6R-6 TaxID=3459303 RepID=UPI00403D9F12